MNGNDEIEREESGYSESDIQSQNDGRLDMTRDEMVEEIEKENAINEDTSESNLNEEEKEEVFIRGDSEIESELEKLHLKKLDEKTIMWEGYEFQEVAKKKVYSIELFESDFKKLWARFENWKGESQKEFYFRFVNPLKFVRKIEPNRRGEKGGLKLNDNR